MLAWIEGGPGSSLSFSISLIDSRSTPLSCLLFSPSLSLQHRPMRSHNNSASMNSLKGGRERKRFEKEKIAHLFFFLFFFFTSSLPIKNKNSTSSLSLFTHHTHTRT